MTPDPDAITSRPSDGGAPLSVAQEGFWLQEKSSADIRRLYNESISLRMKGALDIGVLERSFAEILRRHEIWRTTYAMREGRLVQIVHPPAKVFAFSIQDFRGLPESEQTKEIRKFRDEQTQEPLDLEQGPLLRASLLRVSAEENLLFVVAHLSIVDGVSVYQILPTELAVLYEAFSAGRESPLAELPVQFSDFAYWQREHLDRGSWETQRAFWRARLTWSTPGSRLATGLWSGRDGDVSRRHPFVLVLSRSDGKNKASQPQRRSNIVCHTPRRVRRVASPLLESDRHHYWYSLPLGPSAA